MYPHDNDARHQARSKDADRDLAVCLLKAAEKEIRQRRRGKKRADDEDLAQRAVVDALAHAHAHPQVGAAELEAFAQRRVRTLLRERYKKQKREPNTPKTGALIERRASPNPFQRGHGETHVYDIMREDMTRGQCDAGSGWERNRKRQERAQDIVRPQSARRKLERALGRKGTRLAVQELGARALAREHLWLLPDAQKALAAEMAHWQHDLQMDILTGLLWSGTHLHERFAGLCAAIDRFKCVPFAGTTPERGLEIDVLAVRARLPDCATATNPGEWLQLRAEFVEKNRHDIERAFEEDPAKSQPVGVGNLFGRVEALIAFRDEHITVRCPHCGPGSLWYCEHTTPKYELGANGRFKQVGRATRRGHGQRTQRLYLGQQPRDAQRPDDTLGADEHSRLFGPDELWLIEDAASRLVTEALRLSRVDPTARAVRTRQRAESKKRAQADDCRGVILALLRANTEGLSAAALEKAAKGFRNALVRAQVAELVSAGSVQRLKRTGARGGGYLYRLTSSRILGKGSRP
jgi:hypothetical protein